MVTAAGDSGVQPQDEVDLTDEQIRQLLLEAEGRLRGSLVPATKDTEDAALKYVDSAMASSCWRLRTKLMCQQDPEIVFWACSGTLCPPGQGCYC